MYGKKKMNVPMRDWVIVDNTHEAIIPAEQFELVRRILETETRRPNDAETVALFAGFLYCGSAIPSPPPMARAAA